MSYRGKVVGMPAPPPKSTRFRPTLCDDGRRELISAEFHRRHEAEELAERLSPSFCRTLHFMNDDQIALLEIFAEGLEHLPTTHPDPGDLTADGLRLAVSHFRANCRVRK